MPPAQQLEVGLPDVMMQGVEQYTQVGWGCLNLSVTLGHQILHLTKQLWCVYCAIRWMRACYCHLHAQHA